MYSFFFNVDTEFVMFACFYILKAIASAWHIFIKIYCITLLQHINSYYLSLDDLTQHVSLFCFIEVTLFWLSKFKLFSISFYYIMNAFMKVNTPFYFTMTPLVNFIQLVCTFAICNVKLPSHAEHYFETQKVFLECALLLIE